MKKDSPLYVGKIQPQMRERDISGSLIHPYLPSAQVVEAVNQAVLLQRPLLIAGEPGSGKTSLAQSVAYELGLPFETWYIKSKSRARDGLYTYDAAARLRDAQLAPIHQGERLADHSNPANYLRFGPLGRAFMNDQRTVLLIDEIDKADDDFPDELISALEENCFVIEETGQQIHSKHAPIIFITTEESKQLPYSFVRRCLFHRMEFPAAETLIRIITWHFPLADIELIKTAVEHFVVLREQIRRSGNSRGNLGINTLIDWIHLLSQYPTDQAKDKLEDMPTYGRFDLQASNTREIVRHSRPLQVFLCHSSGDKEAVRTLYHKLNTEGIDPWLDEEKLLPGQDWDQEIKRAVDTSDVVIVCLSRTSINRRGYVQREIKRALDVADEQPDGAIFIIPLKLEECDIPDQLRRWQWVKLFEEDGLEKLMQSLKRRAQALNILEE